MSVHTHVLFFIESTFRNAKNKLNKIIAIQQFFNIPLFF